MTNTPDVPVFYASTEGQTRAVAERLAAVLRDEGIDSRAIDLGGPDAADVEWPRVRGALVGASLHMGAHQRGVAEFVRAHADRLNALPTAFFSVSLSAASTSAAERAEARRIAEALPQAAGWHPSHVASVAGRLAYTQYGFLKRMLLKRIARKEGAPTDTSRDYEFTDWTVVERLAREVAAAARRTPADRNAVPAG